jgi:hypothetical protein
VTRGCPIWRDRRALRRDGDVDFVEPHLGLRVV